MQELFKAHSILNAVTDIAQLSVVIGDEVEASGGPRAPPDVPEGATPIVASGVQLCYQALGILHSMWAPVPGTIKDFISTPKRNGYQGLHSSLLPLGCSSLLRVEVLVRTARMQRLADFGIAADTWTLRATGHTDDERAGAPRSGAATGSGARGTAAETIHASHGDFLPRANRHARLASSNGNGTASSNGNGSSKLQQSAFENGNGTASENGNGTTSQNGNGAASENGNGAASENGNGAAAGNGTERARSAVAGLATECGDLVSHALQWGRARPAPSTPGNGSAANGANGSARAGGSSSPPSSSSNGSSNGSAASGNSSAGSNGSGHPYGPGGRNQRAYAAMRSAGPASHRVDSAGERRFDSPGECSAARAMRGDASLRSRSVTNAAAAVASAAYATGQEQQQAQRRAAHADSATTDSSNGSSSGSSATNSSSNGSSATNGSSNGSCATNGSSNGSSSNGNGSSNGVAVEATVRSAHSAVIEDHNSAGERAREGQYSGSERSSEGQYSGGERASEGQYSGGAVRAQKLGKDALMRRVNWLNSIREWQDEFLGSLSAQEFVQCIRDDLLGQTVFVFTPSGDIMRLPKGATVVDFAYHVHSEVGNSMVAAKVNGRDERASYTLKNADVVEVVHALRTRGDLLRGDQSVVHHKEWLGFAKTRSARHKLKLFIKEHSAPVEAVPGACPLPGYMHLSLIRAAVRLFVLDLALRL